ncbi:MAG TPA: aminotransferase class V-fold PLP-dependent enzyme [Synechococcales cyanobacterium M55_K2018_004]|nr:aminotransferase class V-fold PLP-dependent enzyme [Synechococcales cyanobacterium M55_K2018_004]
MTLASPLTNLLQHRQSFPALGNKSYFNYGGQGPMPEAAIAAITTAHQFSQEHGPFSNRINHWMVEEAAQTRAAIATELCVSPDTLTLTENVSVGCNIALWGMNWHEGDHILLSDCEHPGIVAAVEEIRRRFGVKVSTCPLMATLNAGDPVQVVTQHLRPTTRLVVLSHILWNTGQVLPLKHIVAACHSFPTHFSPVRVLVDAAQSVGVLPLNLADLGADFYALTGHKWLCGPAGLGALYIHPEGLESIRPTFIGWKSIIKDARDNSMVWQPNGQRFEVATSDFTLYGALREAIALHNTWGTAEQRYNRIRQLSADLWQKLCELPHITCLKTTPPDAGLVAFRIPNASHAAVVQSLEQQGFLLRTIADPDCIRACVHYLTLESEIDQLVEALQQLAG